MKVTYLGLGSNIGNKEQNLIRAITFVGSKFKILDYSSIYITSPVGYKNQPHFFNMVLKIDSEGIAPLELLKFVKQAELELGRRKTFRWGPRMIDIDILYIEGVQIHSEDLTVPHRELFNRDFVLIPLSEITECIEINDQIFYLKELISPDSDSLRNVSLFKSKEDIVLYA